MKNFFWNECVIRKKVRYVGNTTLTTTAGIVFGYVLFDSIKKYQFFKRVFILNKVKAMIFRNRALMEQKGTFFFRSETLYK